MSKLFFVRNSRLLVIALLVLVASLGGRAQNANEWSLNVSPLPSPTAPVNDFAGVVDDAVEAEINKKLIAFQRSSGVELAVAVIRTTGDRPISDYSLAVYRGWGIGSKGDDNPGALLLIAVDDRKYFTQVGRDLEDELPDGLVGSLQRQFLVPELRKGDYGKAISDTIDAYIRTYEQRSSGTAASPTPVPGRGQGSDSPSGYSLFCCFVVILIIVLIILSNRGGRSGRGPGGWGGGGFGGGGSVLPWIIGSAIGNAMSSSSSSGWGSSDSGSSWGGSDWGDGGGWGGFGGGGDAGGGGAGGGW